MIYIGIDPGKRGAAFAWDPATGWCARFPVPLKVTGKRRTPKGNTADVTEYDEQGMAQILCRFAEPSMRGQVRAAIETVTTRPDVVRQTDALITGIGSGLWRGMLVMGNIPYQQVNPVVWKRDLFDPALVPEAKGIEKPPQPSRKLAPQERNRLMNQRQTLLKKNACELARRLFPQQADWFKHHTTQDGVAEAALIAYWLHGECNLRWTSGKPRAK